jgi:hypothetical protein
MMENLNKFAVFILTHGRADNVITKKTLDNCGYTGKIYYIVDNEDKHIEKYIENFGKDNVRIFDKKAMADSIDEYNNFDNRSVIIHARNACFDIAKDLGLDYFVQFDDDYTQFKFRFQNTLGYEAKIKNLNNVFNSFINFLSIRKIKSIAFSQGGDHIGGFSGVKLKRKAMNSFICSTKNKFRFIGSINEDVNTYTTLASRGDLFFTFTGIQLDQKSTQTQNSGMTTEYLLSGTYVKSFHSVLSMPSSVKVSMMNTSNPRLHHKVKWKNTTPMIIPEICKK